jgi:hypothetical protein
MPEIIEIKGLNELLQRMTAYPVELIKVTATSMSASLNALWEKVPPYPQQDSGSTYRRTGTLGRSLGSGMQGGAEGSPSVYKVRSLGGGNVEGVFGTNLDYAPLVIGEGTQAGMHSSRWWTIRTIAERAADKIEKIWQQCGELLAQFLEGKK